MLNGGEKTKINSVKLLIIICSFILIGISPASATTVYIQNPSLYDPSTINTDLQTILDTSNDGDTIEFLGNVYYNIQLVINKRLNIISSVNTVIVNNISDNRSVFWVNGSHASGTIIKGFTIKTDSNKGIYVNNTSSVQIKNNSIQSNGDAVNIDNSNDTTVEKSKLYGSKNGVHVIKSGRTTINDNDIENNRQDGICLESSSNVSINRNKIMGNGRHGIHSYDSEEIVVNRSNITKNGNRTKKRGSGIFVHDSKKVKISYSHVDDNNQGFVTEDVENVTANNNTFSDNYGDGICFNRNIKSSLILTNQIQRNNNGIKLNGTSDNLTIRGNVVTDNLITGATDYTLSGDGLIFTAYYCPSLVVTHNIFLSNEHRDIESRYSVDSIEDIVGSNWSRCGCGAPSHDLCGPNCQCKNWDPEMIISLVRTGDGDYTVFLMDPITNTVISDIAPFAVSFTCGDIVQTMMSSGSMTTSSFDISSLSGMVTASIYSMSTSLSWDADIIRVAPETINPQGETESNTNGTSKSNGNGGAGSQSGSGAFSGDGTGSNLGSGTGTSSTSSALTMGDTSSAASSGKDSSSVSVRSSVKSSRTPKKTVSELLIDENVTSQKLWEIFGLIMLILSILLFYYKSEIKKLVVK